MHIQTKSGLHIEASVTPIDYALGLDFLVPKLDTQKGAVFSSGTDYPGRYSRWDMGFSNPALELVATAAGVTITALDANDTVLLEYCYALLSGHPHIQKCTRDGVSIFIEIIKPGGIFAEEDRGKQPSPVSVIRALLDDMAGCADAFLGLYGAFAYDLLFTFDAIKPNHKREDDKLFYLYLPNRIYTVDRRKEQAFRHDYIFEFKGQKSVLSTPQETNITKPVFEAPTGTFSASVDDEHYKEMVRAAQNQMACGNIFEVVFSRTFQKPYAGSMCALYDRLCAHNPSPYQFAIQMGGEQLVGTSPEMFVRIEGRRVESCPISGTVKRSGDPIRDADALLALLNSDKDAVELTMCTDVDRNDKARICKAGSVRILSRRAIETYASLYHTVDHVEGELRDDVSPLDAFLSHMWAVTLTGAPKKIASQFIEDTETSKRGWYGGAVGAFLFSGQVNTGITIRTVHLEAGVASYRAGATLVYDSRPQEEADETRTKAQNFFNVFANKDERAATSKPILSGAGKRVILIDNDDSFVHMLADYIRQTGATTKTYRHTVPLDAILAEKPDLIVHSPGPARPADFNVPDKIHAIDAHNIPQFGVCLGLQGMVEAFGGTLKTLNAPRQGKPWTLSHTGTSFMDGIEKNCEVAAYHALYANADDFPTSFDVLARNENGIIMAIAHKARKLYAVQFHPESLMSLRDNTGFKIIQNIMSLI